MREAVGSTFLFNLMIIFIFFFASFLAIAINYSQAFRIKNQIINVIEQYEGINDTSEEEIQKVINGSGYYREVSCNCGTRIDCDGYSGDNLNGGKLDRINGLCIRQLQNANDGTYYRVTTFVSFNLPIIGSFFTFPVVGETKVIIND